MAEFLCFDNGKFHASACRDSAVIYQFGKNPEDYIRSSHGFNVAVAAAKLNNRYVKSFPNDTVIIGNPNKPPITVKTCEKCGHPFILSACEHNRIIESGSLPVSRCAFHLGDTLR